MSEPNIEVELTDESEFHCFKLTFHVAPGEGTAVTDSSGQAQNRIPIEIYLHTSQALDLFNRLGLAICEKARQDSEELLRQKTGLTTEELVARCLLAPK